MEPPLDSRTTRKLSSGQWHRCPNCGVIDTAQTGHCADGKYGGCGRSFSSDRVFDAHHYYDEELGRYVCEDPAILLDKQGQTQVRRPSRPPIDGHRVWGEPGGRPPRTCESLDNGT